MNFTPQLVLTTVSILIAILSPILAWYGGYRFFNGSVREWRESVAARLAVLEADWKAAHIETLNLRLTNTENLGATLSARTAILDTITLRVKNLEDLQDQLNMRNFATTQLRLQVIEKEIDGLRDWKHKIAQPAINYYQAWKYRRRERREHRLQRREEARKRES